MTMSTLGKVFVMQLPNTCVMADGDELGNGGMWLTEALGRFLSGKQKRVGRSGGD